MIDKQLDHIFETPNAVMRTLAAPSLGSSDLAVWTVEMRAGQAGPPHRAEHDEVERAQLIDGEADTYELADFVLPPGRAKDRRFALREDGRLIASAGILTAAV